MGYASIFTISIAAFNNILMSSLRERFVLADTSAGTADSSYGLLSA
jgi:hypothetical protein